MKSIRYYRPRRVCTNLLIADSERKCSYLNTPKISGLLLTEQVVNESNLAQSKYMKPGNRFAVSLTWLFYNLPFLVDLDEYYSVHGLTTKSVNEKVLIHRWIEPRCKSGCINRRTNVHDGISFYNMKKYSRILFLRPRDRLPSTVKLNRFQETLSQAQMSSDQLLFDLLRLVLDQWCTI